MLSRMTEVADRWATQLYERVDGKGLKQSSDVPQQHTWIQDGTRFLTGRDFLISCKLRVNALPTKARTARGSTQGTTMSRGM